MALGSTDERHLLRTIDLAASARAAGNHPFGSLIVDASGEAIDLAGARGTVGTIVPSAEELAAHREYLLVLDRESTGRCLWLALEAITDFETAPRLAAA